MIRTITFFFAFFFILNFAFAKDLHVGEGQEYPTLSAAATYALPGDAIIVHNGVYTQREDISNLNGEHENPIIIYAEEEGKVIYTGQSEAWHLSSCTHLFIYGFVFEKQTSNGVNIDDGGNFDKSTYDITIKKCVFRDMDASGNNDMLKLSGLDGFVIEECEFINGADGGSGIDMVGCHGGEFVKNKFENMGSNSIQVKGGSHNIIIVQNTFKNGGRRSLNLGGSTGLQYFRPQDAKFEAADILVRANVFIGSWAPIAYVGSTRVKVVNNTFYKPENWVFRILQETVDTSRFVACSNNIFSNNIIYFGNSIHRIVNVGPNTKPETFSFENNLWYNFEDPTFSNPNLPASESNSIIQQDPLFVNADTFNFELRLNSPAIKKGTPFFIKYQLDFKDRYIEDTCSLGAFEYNGVFKDFTEDIGSKWTFDLGRFGGYQTLECKEKIIEEQRELMQLDHFINIGDVNSVIGEYLLYTSDHKVFYKKKDDDEFLTLYDFSLKKGDEFISHHQYLSEFRTRIEVVKLKYIAGKVRKVYTTEPMIILDLGSDQGYFGQRGELIEGINSVKSFMFGNPFEDNYYNHDSLRCFSHINNKGIKFTEKFVDYPCDTLSVGTNDPIFTNDITLFPNPAHDYIDLKFINDFSGIVEIFTVNGEKMLIKKVNSKEYIRIELKDFDAGSYIIKIVGVDFVSSKKLVILK